MENNRNQRKLVRSPEPITIYDLPASVIRTVAATVADVMGGGFISPEPAALINEATNTYIIQSSSMGNDFSSNTTTTTASTTAAAPTDQNTLTTAAKHNIDSLTRIQNYLFKSIDNSIDPTTKNNTLKPICNENNDAGSFDNTAFNDSSDSLYIPQEIEFQKMEVEENPTHPHQEKTTTKYYTKSDEGYYQYSLTSPNNPFLPEIIAEENDVNRYIDWLEENETKCQKMLELEDCDKLSPTNSINFGSKGSKSRNNSRGSSSEKLLMMSLSRSCSGEKSDDSLSGSKHRRKLFSQNSPQTSSNTSRAANPFFCKNSTSSSNDSAPSTASDLLAKREEFLKATMKICLVVSPPVGKLQLKSKSLTQLDGLEAGNTYTQETPLTKDPIPYHTDLTSSKSLHEHDNGGHISPVFLGFTRQEQQSQPQPPSPSQSQSHNPNQHNQQPKEMIPDDKSPKQGIPKKQPEHKKKSFMGRRKPLLTRSAVPSSEYFSVIFQSETGHEEDFIPVRKGVTLSEALQNFLAKRNLTFSQVVITDDNIISVQDGSVPHSSSTIDEHTDLDHLSGKVLRITEKDGSKKVLQKAASFGSRTRPPVLSSSASTEETTDVEPHKLTSKQKQRFSNFFGAKNSQQVEQVCALLNEYTRVGIPEKSSRDYFNNPEYKEAMQYLDSLEGSWKDFVNYEGMSNNEIKIQTAIWELVTTECDYIHILLTLTDLFLACLEALQDKQYLTDIDQNKLFSNIREICDANITFWVTYLYPMVANSQKTSFPMSIDYFHDGFLSFGTYFAPYKKYCAEQSTCQFYCKELTSSNQSFTAYLTWCEAHKTCNRLRLADILVRPMQRLTKYSLLLGAIRKNLFSVDEAENVDSMIHSVETFVCSVNTHLTTRQENERLKGVMARIEFYDVVETTNEHLDKLIKQYSKMFDLCAPMKGCPPNQGRNLFMEGDLKFKDSAGKVDVHCFILTDILLVCKTITKRGQGMLKVIRQPFLTDRLVVVITNNTTLNCVYLNEFDMAISAFILQCPEAKSWHDGLIRAKNAYNRIKQGYNSGDAISTGSGVGAPNTSNTSLRYLMQTSSSGGNADSLSVRKSPLNSSSRVSSSNNSHTGSVEWNDSRNVSVEFEKTNSISSDEGSSLVGHSHVHHHPVKPKSSPNKAITSNTLTVQPNYHLGQSLPNLNLHNPNSNLYHTYSNVTLMVPEQRSGNLLSPNHRGISYPPPSPTR
ncbi:PLEKHG5 family protein [Megaselia abdita]